MRLRTADALQGGPEALGAVEANREVPQAGGAGGRLGGAGALPGVDRHAVLEAPVGMEVGDGVDGHAVQEAEGVAVEATGLREVGDVQVHMADLRPDRQRPRDVVVRQRGEHLLDVEGPCPLRRRARDIERYVAVKQRSLAVKTVRNHLGTMH